MSIHKVLSATFLTFAMGLAACENTNQRQIDTTSRIQIAEDFFSALEREDAETALAMLTDTALLHAPYNPNGDATDAGIRTFPAALYVKGAIGTYDNLVFEDRKFSVADDGQTIWIEAEGRLRVAATGNPYENRYVFKLELASDKIDAITEYTNVATLARDGVTATAPKD